ncbi:AAA family ATPase [Streptomyces sp. NPDC051554]|uniref:phosphatase domain-containing protein n=1 Tax=Streptomyces sp. NPDC051554 TaxID=3365656 RepID=UPI0037A14455
MPTIHVMTGLPASGKTTAARELLAGSRGHIRRVNLDDIRHMLDHHGGERIWSKSHEQTALAVQDAAIRSAIAGGFDVVVDNTHLTPGIPKRIKDAAAGQAMFVVHDFTDVPIDECIRRDADRGDASVGEDVIQRLHANHVKATRNGWRLTPEWLNDRPAVEPYELDPSLQRAVMCDIDGTLALHNGRGPYDFERCGEDRVNAPVLRVLRSFRLFHGDRIVLLSGRGEEFRPHTEAWLAEYNVPYDELHMRPAGDRRRDDIVKAELFDQHVRDRYAVLLSLDDRDRVVALWRRMGLPTWQVNYGAF